MTQTALYSHAMNRQEVERECFMVTQRRDRKSKREQLQVGYVSVICTVKRFLCCADASILQDLHEMTWKDYFSSLEAWRRYLLLAKEGVKIVRKR